jgi:hypothetical protein
MKRPVRISGIIAFLLLASFLFIPQAGAENPTEECAAQGSGYVYVDKIDGIQDGEGTQTITSDMGITYTVTITDNPNPTPDSYAVSPDPAAQYSGYTSIVQVAKFGVGGGLSHITLCGQTTTVSDPPIVVTQPPVIVTEPTATVPSSTVVEAPPTEVKTTTTTTTTASTSAVPATVAQNSADVAAPADDAEPTETLVTALPSTGQGTKETDGHDRTFALVLISAATLIGTAAVVVRQQPATR